MVYSTVDIEPIIISSAPATAGSNGVTGTAGDQNVTIDCSADITPNPLPKDVSPPSFEWFYGPNNTSLPSSVTVSNVTNSGNTYTSTLQFSPLQLYHAGTYICRLGGNERLAASTMITVDQSMSFNLTSITCHNSI